MWQLIEPSMEKDERRYNSQYNQYVSLEFEHSRQDRIGIC